MERFGSILVLTGMLAAGGFARAGEPTAMVSPIEQEAIRQRMREVLLQSKEAVEALDDYSFVMVKRERHGDELTPTQAFYYKWAKPQKVYLKYLQDPHKGREVIFVPGRNGGDLTVHNGSFPDITLDLDPFGSMVMDGNHHPITEAGLGTFINIVASNLLLAYERKEGRVVVLEGQRVMDRPCIKIDVRSSGMGGWYHTVAEGETLWDVAKKHKRDMYQILHHNADKGWDEPDDPDEGDRVYVPRYYASRIEMWVDQETRLPIKALIYDHFGQLYEEFEHRDIQPNIGLTDRDFDVENPDYDF